MGICRNVNTTTWPWIGAAHFWLATSAGLVRFTPALWRPAPAEEKISAAAQSLAREGRWPESLGQIARFDLDPARAPRGLRTGRQAV